MILPQLEHLVVLMLENRSLDSVLGWLYADGTAPSLVLPGGSPARFDGLAAGLFNPSNASCFGGDAPVPVAVREGATSSTVPDPDPWEVYDHVTWQLYGPGGFSDAPRYPMMGFYLDYQSAKGIGDASQIMQAYTPPQLPVLSQLAREFAVSDAWFASVPSQTWPNRAFVHAGTSHGHVNNGEPADPLIWDVETIFNVLMAVGRSWGVYCDTLVTPSLTRTMFPKLWDPSLDDHFHHIHEFEDACAGGALPDYTFLEPSFLLAPTDAHPPHDMEAAEQFIYRVWRAVSTSPAWRQTLLLVTFDEHGGCYDHVLPPIGALAPDAASNPGDESFAFDRFGVRVPAILVSPWIQAGTVFRSPTGTPFDHTSILATLRDWLSLPAAAMLASARIRAAPTFESVLALTQPRSELPEVEPRNAPTTLVSMAEAPNDLQRSLVAATARRSRGRDAPLPAMVTSRQEALDFFARRPVKGY
jgi:phospholipase C